MDLLVTDNIDAAIDAAMALTYEEGLQEIDSFHSSPEQPAGINNNHVEEVQAANPEDRTGTSPDRSQDNGTESGNINEMQALSTGNDMQGVKDDDEFATLMQDIDQLTASKDDDAAQSNLNSQLQCTPDIDSAAASRVQLQSLTLLSTRRGWPLNAPTISPADTNETRPDQDEESDSELSDAPDAIEEPAKEPQSSRNTENEAPAPHKSKNTSIESSISIEDPEEKALPQHRRITRQQ